MRNEVTETFKFHVHECHLSRSENDSSCFYSISMTYSDDEFALFVEAEEAVRIFAHDAQPRLKVGRFRQQIFCKIEKRGKII